jgi:AcrR family transcriptional regulator
VINLSAEETRQLILDVALRQFAQRGYFAVSIRSICKDVGIKESTVYYHFKNKQDILDNLVEEFEAMADRMNQMLAFGFKDAGPGKIDDNNFLRIGRMYYTDFLNNKRNFQFICMLMIEQQNSPALGELFGRLMFERPIEMQTRYFALLVEWGYLKDLPARELAVIYQSIFYFCFCLQMAMRKQIQQAVQELERHLLFFLKQYKKEKL